MSTLSFSQDAKNELCRIVNKKESVDFAEAYGMLLFSRCFTLADRKVKIENGNVARMLADYSASVAGIIPELETKLHHGKNDSSSYIFSIDGEWQRRTLFKAFGHEPDEEELRINRENLKGSKEISAFLRGAFLICGVMTDPNKDYHLEMSVADMDLAEDLCMFISDLDMGIEPAVLEKGGSFIVYIKDSDGIEDFLTLIGATSASMELMQIKMFREAKNDINRKANFETANMDKTYSASAKQTLAIAIINDTIGLEELTDELRAVCELRLSDPEMTLKQMSEKVGISRSGVNHRFQRLIKIAEECTGGRKIEEMLQGDFGKE
ncbi:MAG: DNA-binding protein WhiA [Clostridia bacterium]|nr:DNA-binding protein WhiA [Clostridia bacterium]